MNGPEDRGLRTMLDEATSSNAAPSLLAAPSSSRKKAKEHRDDAAWVDEYGNEVQQPAPQRQPAALAAGPAAAQPQGPVAPNQPVAISDGDQGGPPPNDPPRRCLGVFEEDWSEDYELCPIWGPVWQQVHSGSAAWPQGFQLQQNKLIHQARWCVPVGRTGQILRAHHAVAGHLAGNRLWREAERHYAFAVLGDARRLAVTIMRQCEICQACEHPHTSLRMPIEPFPIPASIMTTVSIDLFQMPEVTWNGEVYNVFCACVDRHSGWVVTTVHHTRGLTAAKPCMKSGGILSVCPVW